MKRLYILAACISLCAGCVTHRSCTVTFAPDHTEVGVSQDWNGLVPGICGFTSHVRYTYAFRLAGQKAEYHDTEIQEIPLGVGVLPQPRLDLYKGTISIFRDKKRVIVKLSQRGDDQKDYPFELNGSYHYH